MCQSNVHPSVDWFTAIYAHGICISIEFSSKKPDLWSTRTHVLEHKHTHTQTYTHACYTYTRTLVMLFRDHFRRISDVDMRTALGGYMTLPRPSYVTPFPVLGTCSVQNTRTTLPNFAPVQYRFPPAHPSSNRNINNRTPPVPPPSLSTVYPWVQNAIDTVNLLQDSRTADLQFKGKCD